MKYFTRLEKTLWICKLVENEKKDSKKLLAIYKNMCYYKYTL